MTDLRSPGNPGGTRGKACTPHVAPPCAEGNSGSATTVGGGDIAKPVVAKATRANSNKVR